MPSKFLFILSHLLSANTSDIATVDIIIVRALVPLQPLPQIWFYSFQLFLMVRSRRVTTCLFLTRTSTRTALTSYDCFSSDNFFTIPCIIIIL
jgi:hypothetical protein